MLVVEYCLDLRSALPLRATVDLNLAHRWFCRLDLTDRTPDHSGCSKNCPTLQIARKSPSGQCVAGSAKAI
ncbi:transposase [uncultured Roseobacter sp.]|uniref:transposase n=1 Tax=uncultured Roseobacter sp. TaxID=114847 RepID=UPI002624E7F0|nr:transposase [uncultured Roseobacter sp.]